MNRILAALLFFLFAASQPHAQDLPVEQIKGLWIVHYSDLELGAIDGRAFVDESGSVEVSYQDPRDKSTGVMRGRIEPGEGGVQIVLRGGIVSESTWRAASAQIRIPAPVPGNATFELGESAGIVAVGVPPPAPDKVHLQLKLSPDGASLSGAWRQAVNPFTGRLDSGDGRIWDFSLKNDGTGAAEMTGVEVWSRPRAQPVLAFPLQDQFATNYGDPSFPEPFGADGRLTRPVADRRLIAFFGVDLPRNYRDVIALESLDNGITYSVHQIAWDFGREGADQWSRKRALDMLTRDKGSEEALRIGDYDLVILDARIAKGVLPGPKTFRLNGAEAAWHLQYGDWSGRLSVSRDLGFNQSDAADVVVPGETIFVEIRTDRDLPISAVPALVAVGEPDGKGLRYALFGKSRSIYLAQDANEPRRYISPPITIVDPEYLPSMPPGSWAIGVVPGEKILAMLAADPVLRLRPSLAEAAVIQSPRHFSAYLTGNSDKRGRTWPDAVKAAASCSGASATDIDALTDQQADEYSDTIVSSASAGLWDGEPSWWITLSTKVKIGEFAGMIFLRDVFVDLLQQKLHELTLGLDDTGLAGFRELIAADVFGQFAAMTSVEIDTPDGGQTPYLFTFSDAGLKEKYGLEGAELERFKTLSTIQARARYADAVRQTMEDSTALGDCDLDGLLKLTGFDMGAVRRIAKQMALRLETADLPDGAEMPRFVADRRARAWIDRVEIVATQLAEQKVIQKFDNAILMGAAAIAALPLALMESPGALTAMFLIDAADSVYAGYELVANLREVASETKFAVGSSAILGSRRFDAAMARQYEWVGHYFGLLATGAGASYSFLDAKLYIGVPTRAMQWTASRLSAPIQWTGAAASSGTQWSAERVRALLARFGNGARSGELEELRRVALGSSAEERVAVIEVMRDAEQLAARIGPEALEAHETEALALARMLDASVTGHARPRWAEGISDDLYGQIASRGRAPHVSEFVRTHPQEMAGLLVTPGAIHALTRQWNSFEDFAAEITRLRNRAPPRPQEFYYQMTGAAPDPPGVHIEGGFSPRGTGLEGRVDFQVNRGDNNLAIGSYAREFKPDAEFNTGGTMLELNFARIDTVGNPDLAWIQGFPYPLTERGVPLGMYMNLRTLNAAGIGHADPSLTVVKFDHIVSVNTCVELDWMVRTYGDSVPLGELFRATHSFRYAQNFLEQAGYGLGEIIVRPTRRRAPIHAYADDFYEGTDLAAFLAQHGLDVNSEIAFGWDVYVRIRPR